MKRFLLYCAAPQRLFFATVLVLLVPNISLCFTEHLGLAAAFCNIVLPLSVYWLAMSSGRRTGIIVWMLFPFIFLAAFQMVLLYLFGRSVIAVDMFLNVVTTNVTEASELLDNLIPAILLVVILYLPVLIAAAVSAFASLRAEHLFLRRQRVWAVRTFVVGLAATLLCSIFDAGYSVKDRLYPVNACYNLCLAVRDASRSAHYAETSKAYSFNARATHPADSAEVYVLVIGETARACNMSLYGYDRPTNPQLSRISGLNVFGHAITQSNTTHKSVPMLLTAASADDHERLYREKGMIAAAREAGFHTVFLTTQRPNRSYIDALGMEAHDFRFLSENAPDGKGINDDILLSELSKVLSEKRKKQFIVLHTYGSHFNYRERYPQSEAFFMPDVPSEALPENRPSLINAYDNSMRNTDRMLAGVIRMLQKQGCRAAMIYTSDHGENIFDDHRKLFLHASPIPSCYELYIPFIVWTSKEYSDSYPAKAEALRRNTAKTVQSSASTFHTMLDLAGIATPAFVSGLSVADSEYRCGPLRYLNDRNEAVPLTHTGMTKEDLHTLKKWGFDIK